MRYTSLPVSDLLISDNNFSEVYKNLILLQYSNLPFFFFVKMLHLIMKKAFSLHSYLTV